MNSVQLTGRLTRDPDIRFSQNADGSNLCIARFTLAVNRPRKSNNPNDQNADFIQCLAFGKIGEFVEKWYKQGIKIEVNGRIQTGSYTNKEGQKVYTTEVVIAETQFAESKGASGGQNAGSTGNTAEPNNDAFMNIPDGIEDDLPFK